MHFLIRLFLLICFVGAVSGCKVGAFYAGTAELEECKDDVSKKFASTGFKSSLEKIGYAVSESNSNVLEIKSSTNDEYGAKLIIQNEKQTLQVIGVDFLPQECGYNRDCPLSEKGRKKMLDLISKIGEAIQCKIGKTTFSDIKKLENPSKQMNRWREDPFFLIE